MNEKPILFSGEMVKAILAGRKTQTRRVIKFPKGNPVDVTRFIGRDDKPNGEYGFHISERVISHHFKCPYGKIGDQLWVRETWRAEAGSLTDQSKPYPFIYYRATDHNEIDGFTKLYPKWKPSIHMPRAASRINLKITDIRVERLQDISEQDAKAEGVECLPDFKPTTMYPPYSTVFKKLWDSINGKPRADGVDISWGANPWVWVPEFRIIK